LSVTGTYAMRNGKLVKISNEVPRTCGIATSDYCQVQKPYWEHNLSPEPVYIESRSQLRNLLKKEGCIMSTPKHGGP
jgi:hypothetical protein